MWAKWVKWAMSKPRVSQVSHASHASQVSPEWVKSVPRVSQVSKYGRSEYSAVRYLFLGANMTDVGILRYVCLLFPDGKNILATTSNTPEVAIRAPYGDMGTSQRRNGDVRTWWHVGKIGPWEGTSRDRSVRGPAEWRKFAETSNKEQNAYQHLYDLRTSGFESLFSDSRCWKTTLAQDEFNGEPPDQNCLDQSGQ